MNKKNGMKIFIQCVGDAIIDNIECQTLLQAQSYINKFSDLYNKIGLVVCSPSVALPSIFDKDDKENYTCIVKDNSFGNYNLQINNDL